MLLNLSALQPKKAELELAVARLKKRNIRMMAFEGADRASGQTCRPC